MNREAIRAELRRIPDLAPIADAPGWDGSVAVEVLEGCGGEHPTVVRIRLRGARVELRYGEDGEVEGWRVR